MSANSRLLRSFEAVLLIAMLWIGIGWLLVNRTGLPNETFLVGSAVVFALIAWLIRQILAEHDG